MDGVSFCPIARIKNDNGDIYHALKSSEKSFDGFGEAYFSSVNFNCIKGWKKHTNMTLNIVVPKGTIKFVVYDDRTNSKTFGNFFTITLSKNNYLRLTIKPGLWLAFQGLEDSLNLLLNIASIEHDPDESINIDLNKFHYEW